MPVNDREFATDDAGALGDSREAGLAPARERDLTLAAVALMLALHVRNGRLDPFAIVLLALTGWALVRAIRTATPPLAEIRGWRTPTLSAALHLGLFAALVGHFIRPPAIHLVPPGFWARVPFLLGLLLAAAVVMLPWLAARAPGELGRLFKNASRWRLPALLVVFLWLGAWVIRHSPDPGIDVFIFQRQSVAALLGGLNPYAMTFPNIYGPEYVYYGANMVRDGQLQFGFPYPPLSLFLSLLGEAGLGDFRYAQLFAMAGAGALMARVRPGHGDIGLLAAALYLFAPRAFFVLEQGWTEPFVVLLLSAVVFAATHIRAVLPVAMGLLLVSKQYSIFMVPLLPWLYSRTDGKTKLRAALLTVVVGAVVSLPLVLWDWRAFWFSVGEVQFHQPFRPDALAFPAAFAFVTGIEAPSALAFVAAIATTVLVWRRCPRTPAGFATAIAAVYFAFFAFNKQAFCNYYWLVFGALCLAVAAGRGAAAGVENQTATR
ncbi:MAG TPA: hypothetical protein VGG33_09815 [Polyangia bacterium]